MNYFSQAEHVAIVRLTSKIRNVFLLSPDRAALALHLPAGTERIRWGVPNNGRVSPKHTYAGSGLFHSVFHDSVRHENVLRSRFAVSIGKSSRHAKNMPPEFKRFPRSVAGCAAARYDPQRTSKYCTHPNGSLACSMPTIANYTTAE